MDKDEIINFTDNAISILEPIANWPDISRAYAAHAVANKNCSNLEAVAVDRANQEFYLSRGVN
jgi:hypothetical protein